MTGRSPYIRADQLLERARPCLCGACGKRFASTDALIDHAERVHGKRRGRL